LHFLNIKTMTDAVKVCSVHFPLFWYSDGIVALGWFRPPTALARQLARIACGLLHRESFGRFGANCRRYCHLISFRVDEFNGYLLY
jgi:hypothetical protein